MYCRYGGDPSFELLLTNDIDVGDDLSLLLFPLIVVVVVVVVVFVFRLAILAFIVAVAAAELATKKFVREYLTSQK
ncbi:hypothetical protein BLA29_006185 [Euroglyphus maynei]|uniref:Uncharacterized protein n=1 Tax=Euroglyphus maynei TaxID=6958 RepID=A0A1Y3BEQ1_EURMA|nr:hypothetical protein BLA29_006185 [Euroglyphus maynei]